MTTSDAIRAWWAAMGDRTAGISKVEWDALDAAIRADERAKCEAEETERRKEEAFEAKCDAEDRDRD